MKKHILIVTHNSNASNAELIEMVKAKLIEAGYDPEVFEIQLRNKADAVPVKPPIPMQIGAVADLPEVVTKKQLRAERVENRYRSRYHSRKM